MTKTRNTRVGPTIRRDRSRYQDTGLREGPHIGIGAPVERLSGWEEDDWLEMKAELQDAAEASGTLVAELRQPVTAQLSRIGGDVKARLEELGWSKAPNAEPLANAAAVIWWTRHDDAGDLQDGALHLLNEAELEHVEDDTLSVALDDVWDTRHGSGGAAAMAVERLCEVLERRRWRSPVGNRDQSQRRLQLHDGDPIVIDVGTVFTETPGPRYRKQGNGSGEAFREEHLLPAVERAVENDRTVVVDIGNVRYGCPIGWLEEVFGGARRALGRDTAMRRIRIDDGFPGTSDVVDAYAFLTEDDASKRS